MDTDKIISTVKSFFKSYSKIVDFVLLGFTGILLVLAIMQAGKDTWEVLDWADRMRGVFSVVYFLLIPAIVLAVGTLIFTPGAKSKLAYVVAVVALAYAWLCLKKVSLLGYDLYYFNVNTLTWIILILVLGGTVALFVLMLFVGKSISVDEALKSSKAFADKAVDEGKKLVDKVDGDKK